MNRIFLFFFLFLYFPAVAYPQILKGRITNSGGEPIPYATVYISEKRQGTTANAKGDYEIKLPAGTYKFTFQSLGYDAVETEITLSGTVTRNIMLPIQYYQIPEVRVTASGEDPAYIIMRKVIGMAPYYLNNIRYYKAEVYLKGNLILNRIPRILERQIEKDEDISIKEGDSYFMESYNEIEFTAPDKYVQRVLSFNSTFPEQGNEVSPMSFIQASFYEPEIADMAISPLSPAAFGHYNFRYLGISMQGDHVINKIQVTPKRKSQQLFEGTIFIIEDLWCLHSVDLVNENLAAKIRVKQLYAPLQDGIWMPVSHNFDINVSIMGVKVDATYGSSVKYLDVKPNTELKRPESIAVNTPSKDKKTVEQKPVSKTEEQISRILSKDELTNRDMVRLSRLMEKKSEQTVKDTAKKPLEVVNNNIQKVEKDANKKDTSYWSQIRPIPLSDAELRSIRVSDSIKARAALKHMKEDTLRTGGQEKKEPGKFFTTIRQVASGHTWRDTTGNWFRFGGLADMNQLSFNTVDGFIYGMDFSFGKNNKNGSGFSIAPVLRWAFSREQLLWRVNTWYRFPSPGIRQIYLRAGQNSVDFNTGGGINLFLNTSYTLLLRKNNLKLFESGHVTLGYSTNISTSVNLDLSVMYQDRRMLENNTDFSFFRSSREYTPNLPVNRYLLPGQNPNFNIRDMRHARFTAVINYTPFMRYRVVNNRKIPVNSDWPTFTLAWSHGLNEFTELENPVKQYDMLRFEFGKQHQMGAFSELRWRFRTGGFINNKYVTFYDFYHVNTQPLPLLMSEYHDAFMLPDFYSLSTPQFYVQAHTKYTTPYLIIKYLPFLSNTLIRENLKLSYMGSVNAPHYTEIGYSLSEIFLLAEFGVYVGFENLRYRSAGVSLTLKLN